MSNALRIADLAPIDTEIAKPGFVTSTCLSCGTTHILACALCKKSDELQILPPVGERVPDVRCGCGQTFNEVTCTCNAYMPSNGFHQITDKVMDEMFEQAIRFKKHGKENGYVDLITLLKRFGYKNPALAAEEKDAGEASDRVIMQAMKKRALVGIFVGPFAYSVYLYTCLNTLGDMKVSDGVTGIYLSILDISHSTGHFLLGSFIFGIVAATSTWWKAIGAAIVSVVVASLAMELSPGAFMFFTVPIISTITFLVALKKTLNW